MILENFSIENARLNKKKEKMKKQKKKEKTDETFQMTYWRVNKKAINLYDIYSLKNKKLQSIVVILLIFQSILLKEENERNYEVSGASRRPF